MKYLLFNIKTKPDVMAQAYNSSYLGGGGRRISSLRPAQAKLVKPTLSQKQNQKTSKVGDTAQVVKHLPSKCQALSSNPSTGQINK
jgi:hypothetical protein